MASMIDFDQLNKLFELADSLRVPFSTFPQKWWKNDDLEEYAVLGAEALESTNIVRLGENMMVGLMTSRESYRLGDIIAVLAVHIRKADWTTRLIPAELLANKQEQIESLTDQDFLEKLEQETGRLACLQVTQQGEARFVLRGTKEQALAHTDQSTVDKILGTEARSPTKEKILGAFITSVRKWDVELQACWYTFLAACISRVITKPPATVQKHVTRGLFAKFRQFYGAPMIETPVPEPLKATLEFITIQLKKCRVLSRFVITSFLKGLKLAVVDKDTRCRGILEFSLLVHTSYTGLQLISLLHQVMEVLGTTDVKYITDVVHDYQTTRGVELIIEYCNRYGTSSSRVTASGGFALVLDEANIPYHLWSALLDERYLSDLRIKNHDMLTARFCAIIDPDQKKGGVWSMPGLQMCQRTRQLICDAVRLQLPEIKEKAKQWPKPTTNTIVYERCSSMPRAFQIK